MRHRREISRGGTVGGVVGGFLAMVIGVVWTGIACGVSQRIPGPFGVLFPLFGVAFIIKAIVSMFSMSATDARVDRAFEAAIAEARRPVEVVRAEPVVERGKRVCDGCGAGTRGEERECRYCGGGV